jgi:hypothetical protein
MLIPEMAARSAPAVLSFPQLNPRLPPRTLFNDLPSVARTMDRSAGLTAIRELKSTVEVMKVLEKESGASAAGVPPRTKPVVGDPAAADSMVEYMIAKGRTQRSRQATVAPAATLRAECTSETGVLRHVGGKADDVALLTPYTQAGSLSVRRLQSNTVHRKHVAGQYQEQLSETLGAGAMRRIGRDKIAGAIHAAAHRQREQQELAESILQSRVHAQWMTSQEELKLKRAQASGKPPELVAKARAEGRRLSQMSLADDVDLDAALNKGALTPRTRSGWARPKNNVQPPAFRERGHRGPGTWLASPTKYRHNSVHSLQSLFTPRPEDAMPGNASRYKEMPSKRHILQRLEQATTGSDRSSKFYWVPASVAPPDKSHIANWARVNDPGQLYYAVAAAGGNEEELRQSLVSELREEMLWAREMDEGLMSSLAPDSAAEP